MRRGASGFTLVELLVVMGIIAVVAALALPAMASARQTAQTSVTLQRLGQLATVANLYTTDNEGRIWTASNWLRSISDGEANAGLLLEGGYIDSAEALECAVNARRAPRPLPGQPTSLPPSVFGTDGLDSDFAFVHQVEGARVGLHTRFAFHRSPRERGWSAGVWLEDESELTPLDGVPLFVEEAPRFGNAWDPMVTFKGFDQLDRRHAGGPGGRSLVAYLEGHAGGFAPPVDDSPTSLEVSDLTASGFFLSARGGRWRAMTLSRSYDYGWVNDPR